jgi:hypothetical protein
MFLSIPVLLAVTGCPKGGNEEWERFNAESDAIEVQVTASDALGDPVSAPLHSTTGEVEVGSVTITPGSGPVGTIHEIRVEVLDEYETEVGRVTAELDAGDRGAETVTQFVQDSADHGLWIVEVESRGDEGEERTDTFSIQLWAPTEEQSSGGGDTDS